MVTTNSVYLPAYPTVIAVILLLGKLKQPVLSFIGTTSSYKKYIDWKSFTSSSKNLHFEQKYFPIHTPQVEQFCLTWRQQSEVSIKKHGYTHKNWYSRLVLSHKASIWPENKTKARLEMLSRWTNRIYIYIFLLLLFFFWIYIYITLNIESWGIHNSQYDLETLETSCRGRSCLRSCSVWRESCGNKQNTLVSLLYNLHPDLFFHICTMDVDIIWWEIK